MGGKQQINKCNLREAYLSVPIKRHDFIVRHPYSGSLRKLWISNIEMHISPLKVCKVFVSGH